MTESADHREVQQGRESPEATEQVWHQTLTTRGVADEAASRIIESVQSHPDLAFGDPTPDRIQRLVTTAIDELDLTTHGIAQSTQPQIKTEMKTALREGLQNVRPGPVSLPHPHGLDVDGVATPGPARAEDPIEGASAGSAGGYGAALSKPEAGESDSDSDSDSDSTQRRRRQQQQQTDQPQSNVSETDLDAFVANVIVKEMSAERELDDPKRLRLGEAAQRAVSKHQELLKQHIFDDEFFETITPRLKSALEDDYFPDSDSHSDSQ
jgi:hypothetical protein